jgi:hypothetical protein
LASLPTRRNEKSCCPRERPVAGPRSAYGPRENRYDSHDCPLTELSSISGRKDLSSLPELQDALGPPDQNLKFAGTPAPSHHAEKRKTCHLRALWCNGLHVGYILIKKYIFKGRSSNLCRTVLLFFILLRCTRVITFPAVAFASFSQRPPRLFQLMILINPSMIVRLAKTQ